MLPFRRREVFADRELAILLRRMDLVRTNMINGSNWLRGGILRKLGRRGGRLFELVLMFRYHLMEKITENFNDE